MLPRQVLQTSQRAGTALLAVPPEAAEIVARQEGVLSRDQLAGLAFSPSQVRWAVRDGRWQIFGRRVVVLQNSPLTLGQRQWVAVLMPGKPAALAGLSGAAAAGLRGFEPERVHIVVRHATHTPAPVWVKLHESRRFAADDIAPASAPPRTGTARAVIDAATWSRYPRRACAILCAAAQQRLVTAQQLATELQAAGHVRHVQVMRDILGDIAGGGHTLAEIDLAGLARCAGLGPVRR